MPSEKHLNKLLLVTALCLIHPALCLADLSADEDYKLTGTVIGTEQSFDYGSQSASTTVNTVANAFDGDLSTYVATYERSHTWAGLDLGTPHVITRVGWSPRNGSVGPDRVVLGLFEGSNREDFMDAIPLYMITEKGTIGIMSYADVNVSRGFRYVRWCAPADSRCNIAELEFYGHEGDGDDSQFYQLTNLPTLSYHTYEGIEPYDKVHELESETCIIYDGGTRIQEYPTLVRERGNGSRHVAFLKRPYRLKFNDGKSHYMLKGSPLQSTSKCKKWTLLPNWREKSLMRNNIAFEMSRRLGLSYTPWIQNVDVIVNGEYKGNYQLCDQVTVDRNRVDITEMQSGDVEEPNISGGYLLEITNSGGEKYHFNSDYSSIPVDVKYPDEDDITPEQFAYIRDAFNDMESRLWDDDYQHPENGYRSKLDLDNFLRYFLVGEFAGNTDAMWSLYLYKEREDDLFHFGPVWDFDLCMDNDQRTYPANGKPDWLYNYGSAVTGIRSFVSRILSDPAANEMLCSIWAEMRESGAFSRDSLWGFVDSLSVVLDESQKLNFTRWDNLGTLLTLQQFAPGTYRGEVNIIKNYLKERILWIDNKLGYEGIPDPPETLDFVISTPQELEDFAERVNDGLTNANAIVTTDLDFQGQSIVPIGTQLKPYIGCFDGGGHTFSNLRIESGSNYTGLFGVVSGGATIKNFVLDETCSISGAAFVGIIGGSNNDGIVTMECLGNEGSVTASKQNAGGIFGCNMSAAATPIFINCYVTGPVKGERDSGQITGYAANGKATNCYGIGTIEGYYYQNLSDAMLRGNPQSTNCYSTTPDKNVTVVASNQIVSGELCYLLNQNLDIPVWYQTLGVDDHPVLDATHGIVMLADDGTYYSELPDGIRSMGDTYKQSSTIVNLAGQRVMGGNSSNRRLPKGIYIVNGRKVSVR